MIYIRYGRIQLNRRARPTAQKGEGRARKATAPECSEERERAGVRRRSKPHLSGKQSEAERTHKKGGDARAD